MTQADTKGTSIGVIGAGVISQQVHIPVLLNLPGTSVCWVADISKLRADAVASAYGLKGIEVTATSVLPHAEVVLIAVPPGARSRYYEEYAARRTGVLAEKPFAITLAEHDRYAAMFPAHSLGCGYQRRFYGSTRLLKTVIQEQWFGPLRSIQVAEGGRTVRTGSDSSYIDDLSLSGGGVLISLGCHALDAILDVTGAQTFDVVSREFVMDGSIDRKAIATLQLHGDSLRSPCPFDYAISWLDRQSNSITLEFDSVLVRTPIAPGVTIEVKGKARSSEWTTLTEPGEAAGTSYQAFYLEWMDFLRGLKTQTPSTISASSARLTACCLEELYKGRPNE